MRRLATTATSPGTAGSPTLPPARPQRPANCWDIRRARSASFTNNNSTLLLHTGATIKSHTISNGIVTFNDGTGSQSLITAGDVAAATQYMSFNDWGNAGATVAFTATLSA